MYWCKQLLHEKWLEQRMIEFTLATDGHGTAEQLKEICTGTRGALQ
jgi:hypothetical protein